MIKRKLSCALLAALLVFQVCGCRAKQTGSSTRTERTTTTKETTASEQTTTEETTETSESTTAPSSETSETTTEATETTSAPNVSGDILDRLKTLDRVSSVEEITTAVSLNQDARKFLITFDMPLDWKNPDAGSFPQRAEFVYVGDDHKNVFCCDGYMLYEQMLNFIYRCEFAEHLDANYVNVEHRFFGKSVPDGLDTQKLDYWEYLTAENAAEDFHFIISELKKVLPEKWAFTGASKGGQLTNMQSHFHPEDAEAYVALVAPGGSDQDAPDFFDFIYNEIGEERFGKDNAKKVRDMVLEFQVECIKNRDTLAEKYYKNGIDAGCVFTDFTTPDILFDMAVLEFATIFWQYGSSPDIIEGTLKLKDSDNKQEYLDALLSALMYCNTPDVWSNNTEYFPYYVQAARQNGEHEYDFSFLRKALEEDGSGASLVVTEDMEKGLLFRMVFTDEQYKAFTFDDSVYKDMLTWSHTTTKTSIMIYGGADVWYTVRLPDVTDNPNVHIYVAKASCHNTMIVSLSPSEQEEIYDILEKALA
ncbi:MAG: hypothetical protein J5752_00380 [Clostridiales bacterium]|nr:hypothetical protein [Clostridiales bacterium]